MLATAAIEGADALPRRPLVVKPILTYPLTQRRPQTSWRNWGGIETRADVDGEVQRIRAELDELSKAADFPLRFLPVTPLRAAGEFAAISDVAAADVLLVYAAGDGAGDLMGAMNPVHKLGKDVIFLVRHQSGPLYYWYEGIMARYLHQHTDELAVPGVDYEDVVVDSMDEVLWRLRALCGLRNTIGSRIVCIGGAGSWGQPVAATMDLVQKRWQLHAETVSYEELEVLLRRRATTKLPWTGRAARRRRICSCRKPRWRRTSRSSRIRSCWRKSSAASWRGPVVGP